MSDDSVNDERLRGQRFDDGSVQTVHSTGNDHRVSARYGYASKGTLMHDINIMTFFLFFLGNHGTKLK